ncbi:NADH-quinone oxidoreductase subunit J [Botrimarina colliarenosi]|uniref:NADH-quinone oxidoreductase subunit J n=1 Tax=Botrimarina colliarenosi TaxID=2528001 RepID=A0A5C6AJ07_9BACT|nr:NADH-quinone oxidoreductase subunit J [Botrimarina colliarenosi]TWU00005.1 NADH-quinone oxidoreductase subunit J [Botrimarina colliarenosi]
MIWHSVLFTLFAAIACGFAMAVVFTSNVVRMAFYLVISLSATSGLFFLAGADFVGAMQLMIYVGGTLVLLIFGVMLTAQQRFVQMRPSRSEVLLAGLLGAALLVLLASAAVGVPTWRGSGPKAAALDEPPLTATPIALGLLGFRVDGDPDDGQNRAGYLLPFEIISVHLLVVLVGAAYLARTRLTAGSLAQQPPGGFEQDAAEDRIAEVEAIAADSPGTEGPPT